jgi:hypothetical protein
MESMTHAARGRIDLAQIVERCAADVAEVRQLLLRDETFRTICEDHALASETLAMFERLPASEAQALEIAEYRELIVELEREIKGALRAFREGK